MAHIEQRVFFDAMRSRFPAAFDGVRVLEIGSLDINGSVRDFYTNADYTGVDLAPGPGVDVVGQGQDLDYADRSFDVSVSAECFEHNPYWLETFANMTRMASHMVFLTCASHGRPEHGTARTDAGSSPLTVAAGWDYYRNLGAEDFDWQILAANFSTWGFSTNESSHDLYFYGVRNRQETP